MVQASLVQASLFYLFSGTLIGSALMVIAGRNAVHSVLFLIMAFLNAAGLFLLAGAELLAFTLVIVYIGAVAVLFLFVVMMLDLNLRTLSEGITRYKLAGTMAGLILAGELITIGIVWKPGTPLAGKAVHPVTGAPTNAQGIGEILYTDYFYLFQLSGIILLVAIIGAIVLTHRTRPRVRHQNYQGQLTRSPSSSLKMVKVVSGEGIPDPE